MYSKKRTKAYGLPKAIIHADLLDPGRGLLMDGSLLLQARIAFVADHQEVVVRRSVCEDSEHVRAAQNFSALWRSRTGTDFTLVSSELEGD